ncbi:MAG: sugar phosphate isomerase/epimerase family protein [Candidatus Poribacteria bacterium]
MPKYGISLLLWTDKFDKESVKFIQKAAEMGFDGIEIPFFAPETVDIQATKEALEEHNMGCIGCAITSPGRDLISFDPTERQTARDYLRECIEITAKLGGDTLIGPVYSVIGKLVGRARTDEEWDFCVNGLKEIAEFAEQHEVTLAMEPINRFETYFVNTAADVVHLANDVDSPYVKVMLDTFHMNIEEKSYRGALECAGDLLHHVHCCENDRGTPGTGLVRWDEVFETLAKMNYNRWFVIESFVPNIEAIAAAAAIWRDIAPSADALATEGLAFLKKMGEKYLS